MTDITKIRFFCTKHNKSLVNCGSGRVFTPTCTTEEDVQGKDEVEVRKDKDGWLGLDTSELTCPIMLEQFERGDDDDEIDRCYDHWTMQAQ